MHDCPQCGYTIEDEGCERCPECGFNFNYLLDCPHKLSNKCIHNGKECYIEGLNFEACQIYLHKIGFLK